ncbi:methionine--tRNA ligase, partial [Chloroflexota bacterium]
IAAKYQQEFLESWQRLGISFDLFTTTSTANHAEVTRDIFLTLLKKEYIYRDTVSQAFCPNCQRFLPDRYIHGTCPYCSSTKARGDQCDDCGKPLNPGELVKAQCLICDTAPVFRDSEHFFLKLSAFQHKLSEWAGRQKHWRPNVSNLTKRYLNEGLKDRAITRDINWGIPVPVPGFEDKRIYVWFEAVIGYLSASKERAKQDVDPEKWRSFWQSGAKGYYFIGKDNIPFHTLIWPAILMGYDDDLNLPYDVPANEFLTIERKKLSTSQNWAVWVPDYLSRYQPDPLRYILSINMPDTGDTDFSWREFVRRNNDELVATYGNLVNRVLTFVYKNFDGRIPSNEDMGAVNKVPPMDERDRKLDCDSSERLRYIYDDNGLLYRCKFKKAITMAMNTAHEANRFLDEKSPWKVIKEDRQAAASSLYLVMNIINRLKIMLYPFLPFSSQKVHEYLGFKGNIEDSGIQLRFLEPGQKLVKPQPLFTKLDESIIEEETARLGT